MSLTSKRVTDKWVAELEEDGRAAIIVARRMARIRPASKVAGAASRRDPLADERIFLAIARSIGAGHDTVMTDGRRPLVQKGRQPIFVLKPDQHDEDGNVTRTIWTPDWTHTGDRLKLFAMASSLSGDIRTINISLSDAVTMAALKSERGFVGYMSERMTRHLKGAGDTNPTYAFIIEGSPAHRLHIHGFIQTSVPDLRKVLATVAGEASFKAKERQVHTVRAWNLPGWTKYIAKSPCVTAEELSRMRGAHGLRKRADRLVGASASLRAQGKRWYEETRSSKAPISVGGYPAC